MRNLHGLDDRGLLASQRGRFGTMFSRLSRSSKKVSSTVSFPVSSETLGALGGPMDGGMSLGELNSRIPAGYTYLGQFLDHDITFDATSLDEKQKDPDAILNFRTAAFELDSLYGRGPDVDSYLYDVDQPGLFLLGPPQSRTHFDLPRNSQHQALIADRRNDENLIISQLHLAFLKFHNFTASQVNDFQEARRLVRWHYQWIILHEFLPLIVGKDVVAKILQPGGRQFYYLPEEEKLPLYEYPYIPVEFSVAAYRFGHSQVLPEYRINDYLVALLFPEDPNAPWGDDLRGRRPVTEDRRVDWAHFFPLAQSPPRASNKINTRIARPLLRLPYTVVPPQQSLANLSLAVRNLKRGERVGLPSGQEVAEVMGGRPLDERELWTGVPGVTSGPAPLWYYILKEAELQNNGELLGDVGGRIVAEVFIGLLQADADSYVNQNPCWKPTLARQRDDDFTMVDLLRLASSVD